MSKSVIDILDQSGKHEVNPQKIHSRSYYNKDINMLQNMSLRKGLAAMDVWKTVEIITALLSCLWERKLGLQS